MPIWVWRMIRGLILPALGVFLALVPANVGARTAVNLCLEAAFEGRGVTEGAIAAHAMRKNNAAPEPIKNVSLQITVEDDCSRAVILPDGSFAPKMVSSAMAQFRETHAARHGAACSLEKNGTILARWVDCRSGGYEHPDGSEYSFSYKAGRMPGKGAGFEISPTLKFDFDAFAETYQGATR